MASALRAEHIVRDSADTGADLANEAPGRLRTHFTPYNLTPPGAQERPRTRGRSQ
jgi:hypothetical protein